MTTLTCSYYNTKAIPIKVFITLTYYSCKPQSLNIIHKDVSVNQNSFFNLVFKLYIAEIANENNILTNKFQISSNFKISNKFKVQNIYYTIIFNTCVQIIHSF